MKRNVWIFVPLLMGAITLFFGCGKRQSDEVIQREDEVAAYKIEASKISLEQDYNPYIIDANDDGVFYYAENGREGVHQNKTSSIELYFTDLTGKTTTIGLSKEVLIKDLSASEYDGVKHFVVLC